MRRAGYRGPEFGDFSLEAPLPHILFYLFLPRRRPTCCVRSLPAKPSRWQSRPSFLSGYAPRKRQHLRDRHVEFARDFAAEF